MRVRLIKKLAETLDGIDLSGCSVGDVLDLPRRAARLLISENWAYAEARRSYASNGEPQVSGALDRPKVSKPKQIQVDEESDLQRLFRKLSAVRAALPRRRKRG